MLVFQQLSLLSKTQKKPKAIFFTDISWPSSPPLRRTKDFGDTSGGLGVDAKFLEDFDTERGIEQKLFDGHVKYRTADLAALADTIENAQ